MLLPVTYICSQLLTMAWPGFPVRRERERGTQSCEGIEPALLGSCCCGRNVGLTQMFSPAHKILTAAELVACDVYHPEGEIYLKSECRFLFLLFLSQLGDLLQVT